MDPIDYFGGWRAETFSCPQCDWQGLGDDLVPEVWDGLVTLDCPACNKTVAGFPHLTRDQIEKAAAAGHPEAITMLARDDR